MESRTGPKQRPLLCTQKQVTRGEQPKSVRAVKACRGEMEMETTHGMLGVGEDVHSHVYVLTPQWRLTADLAQPNVWARRSQAGVALWLPSLDGMTGPSTYG